jgi:hypothetical protein
LYQKLGGYAYDRDPQRPGWFSLQPARDYARPAQGFTTTEDEEIGNCKVSKTQAASSRAPR